MPRTPDNVDVDERTKQVDQADAETSASADRPPTPDEEQAAERAETHTDDVAPNYEEAMERGKNQRGEGKFEVN